MSTTANVSRALYSEVCRVATAMGYSIEAASCHVGRIPLSDLSRLLDGLRGQSGDPDIGLRIGRLLNPACFAITGYLVMAGPTLMDALPRITRFQRLVADGISLRSSLDASRLSLRLQFSDPRPARELVDLLMSGLRFFGAWLLGREPPLLGAQFSYAAPGRTCEHTAIFGRELEFGCSQDGFSLSRAWLSTPLCTANPALVPLLERHALRLLATFRREPGLAAITQTMIDLLPGGAVGIAAIAARLGTSTRSLQRTIGGQGTTFSRLLQEVRMRLANEYLAAGELPLQEIAEQLGYQEQSSFCHAYRQWTGRAPGDARRAMRGIGSASAG